MIALVRCVRTARTESTVMFWESRDTSAKTGLAPARTTQLAEAMNDRGVTITSSPAETPAASSARSSATVPFARETAKFPPKADANSASNCRHRLPVQKFTLPERRTSSTASISSSVYSGHGSRLPGRLEPDTRLSACAVAGLGFCDMYDLFRRHADDRYRVGHVSDDCCAGSHDRIRANPDTVPDDGPNTDP